MKSNKHDNSEIHIALLEQTNTNIYSILQRMEKKQDQYDVRFDKLLEKLDLKFNSIEQKFDKLSEKMDSNFKWILTIVIGLFLTNSALVSYLNHTLTK